MSYLPRILYAARTLDLAFMVRSRTHWPAEWDAVIVRGALWVNDTRVDLKSTQPLPTALLHSPDWEMGRGERHEAVWRGAEETLLHYGRDLPPDWTPRTIWDILKEEEMV